MTNKLIDAKQRDEALDPARSFIVQAPAGSGKTELLTQRFLRLLSVVAHPEEIVAITFTRKAAAEMRSRVLDALRRSGSSPPESPHERTTWELARSAAKRDEQLNWNVLSAPTRLKITTVDAFCHGLARRSPLLSGVGTQPRISEDAEHLHQQAARRALEHALEEGPRGDAVRSVLDMLDNRADQLEDLLAGMLGKRDQWLRSAFTADEHLSGLRNAFREEVDRWLTRVTSTLPDRLMSEWVDICRFAAANVEPEGAGPLAALKGAALPPRPVAGDHPVWLAMTELLFTATGAWRKSVNRRLGFPARSEPGSADEKARRAHFKERHRVLIESLCEVDGARDVLSLIRKLPGQDFTSEQEARLQALLSTLKTAAAELKLVFKESGAVDFIEIASQAVAALGTGRQPTDLALIMDYSLTHLLVDEFQDTSVTQTELLAKLVANFEPGDGRSLFLVGDPMQSIYRFREAEVGLFLHARSHGVGPVRLEPLNLRSNFRSAAAVVEWVNRVFPDVFPATEEATRGAVTYVPAHAVKAAPGETDVGLHAFAGEDAPEREAARVCAVIRRTMASAPSQTIAVLGRTRHHLKHVVAALRAEEIPFHAVDMEPLAKRPVIMELGALTRALAHPADRLAWLAVLRAPWCGLTLDDLARIAAAPEGWVWAALQSAEVQAAVSADGLTRLERFKAALEPLIERAGRVNLHEAVERAWLGLGGPACVSEARDLTDAARFFEVLSTLVEGGTLTDFGALERQIERLYAEAHAEGEHAVQVMTIHKAKGLEFDTVIVPGLGQSAGRTDTPLVSWAEVPGDLGPRLLLAPARSSGEAQDPHFEYVKHLNEEKVRFEEARLAYVAFTRAKQRLHVLGHVKADSEEGTVRPPPERSLLGVIWPGVEAEFAAGLATTATGDQQTGQQTEAEGARPPDRLVLTRLPASFKLPAVPFDVTWEGGEQRQALKPQARPEFDWAGGTARAVGVVVHRALTRLTDMETFDASTLDRVRSELAAELVAQGVADDALETALARTCGALEAAARDPFARWALLTPNREARSELGVMGWLDGRLEERVIDRTFVDESGVRWVIDIKTSLHEGGDLESFLEQEVERYRPQLVRYARLMRMLDDRPLRAGLYFPMHSVWREVAVNGDALGGTA